MMSPKRSEEAPLKRRSAENRFQHIGASIDQNRFVLRHLVAKSAVKALEKVTHAAVLSKIEDGVNLNDYG
jgi:hypothetical protein